MLLFYIRHGDPIYDPDGLTDLGFMQAEAIKKRLGVYGLDKIYASSSNRAILTATPTAKMLKKEIEILDWCNEKYVWNEFSIEYDGNNTWICNHTNLYKTVMSKEMYALGRNWVDHPIFEGSRIKYGMKRVDDNADEFLLSLGYRHSRDEGVYYAEKPNDERVALFAHEGFGMAFLSSIIDIPYPMFTVHHQMSHTGMTVIDFSGNDVVVPKILQYSNDSHLFADRIVTKYNNYLYF